MGGHGVIVATVSHQRTTHPWPRLRRGRPHGCMSLRTRRQARRLHPRAALPGAAGRRGDGAGARPAASHPRACATRGAGHASKAPPGPLRRWSWRPRPRALQPTILCIPWPPPHRGSGNDGLRVIVTLCLTRATVELSASLKNLAVVRTITRTPGGKSEAVDLTRKEQNRAAALTASCE